MELFVECYRQMSDKRLLHVQPETQTNLSYAIEKGSFGHGIILKNLRDLVFPRVLKYEKAALI